MRAVRDALQSSSRSAAGDDRLLQRQVPRRCSRTTRASPSAGRAARAELVARVLVDRWRSKPAAPRSRSRIDAPRRAAKATDETSTAPPAPVTPQRSPKTTISGSSTAASTPWATAAARAADRDRERLRPAEDELDRGGDEDEARRGDRGRVRRRRAAAGRATASSSSAGTRTTAIEQRRAGHVAAQPGEHDLGPAVLPVARLLGQQDHPQRRREHREARTAAPARRGTARRRSRCGRCRA